ncbi:MAG: hypothetical protein JXJ04_05935 [Spirochaetales bacterium]|nr:hypothetical protein [Spirochaetales bacterium]
MIYIFTQIYNFSQLEKINPEVISHIQQTFSSLSQSQKCPLYLDRYREGIFLFTAGEENQNDPRRITDIIFQIHESLMNKKKDLYGFNTFVSIMEKSSPSHILDSQKNCLYLLEEEEFVWISKKEHKFFSKNLIFEKSGDFYKVSIKKEPGNEHSHPQKPFWLRQMTYNQLFDEITPVINGLTNNTAIYIYGENGTGKTTIASHIAKTILGEDYKYIPRMYTLFKKQSFLHPFLNSIHPEFLVHIPLYLEEHEKKIWLSQGKLLSSLKQSFEAGICPDHLFEDFFISYNLYLSGYIRMMKQKLKPAFFICDDLDAYTSVAFQGLQLLLKDFLQDSVFIPLLISQSETLPEAFSQLPVKKVGIHPVSQRETKKLIHYYYPGLKVTKKIANDFIEYSKAQILPIKSLLGYFFSNGIITKKNGSYLWDPEHDGELNSGLNQSKILNFLIHSLKQNELDIIYYIYLSAGMFTTEELYTFLEMNSYPHDFIAHVLLTFSHYGLVSTGDYTTPYYPGLKKQIEDILKSRITYLSDVYLNHIIELWRERKSNRYVLLFSLFMTHKRTSLALEILQSLIKRKLDEGDINETKPFLSLKNPIIKYQLNEKEHKQFFMIIIAAQLRISLIEENTEYAQTLINRINEENLPIDQASEYRGDVYLQMASYYNLNEESDMAVSLTKKALLDYQDLGLTEKKAHAYSELGVIMLADQKVKDAHDYFILALRLFPEDFRFPHNKIRVLILTGITYYLQGNLSKSLQSAMTALETAHDAGKRNWELLSVFLTGRIYFDLGRYEDAQSQFLIGLSITSIYSITKARKILKAWLGRSYIYSGKIKDGLKTLNSIKPNKEVLFFLAEAYFFLKQYDKALDFIDRSVKTKVMYARIPDEKMEWKDGYALVEGKYSKISRKGTIFNRLLKVFRAYLLSHCLGLKEGINEFYKILRTEKDSKVDPHYSLYYFLYSQLLQKSGEDENDDYMTILNKALKQLQERASRIEAPADRTKYLFNNFWNNHIFNEAKKKNLV